MIRSFKSKELEALWQGRRSKIDARFRDRIIRRLEALDEAAFAEEMNIQGFDFHALRGAQTRYSVHVNGPWCITFEFAEGDAIQVNFEQYH